MAQLANLKQNRARIRGFITRTINSLTENTTDVEAESKLEKVKETWNKYEDIQEQIEQHEPEGENEIAMFLVECEKDRELFENQFFQAEIKLKTIIRNSSIATSPQTNANITNQGTTQQPRNLPKLPDMKLPEFSGNYAKWIFFKNSFEAIIHKEPSITKAQKQQYLISALKDEARSVVENFPISDENYDLAWTLLNKTYDDQLIILQKHLDDLLNFPEYQKDNKADSLRKLSWHIQTHISALKSLHAPAGSWDTIIIHLAKRHLDYTTQREWQDHLKGVDLSNLPNLSEFTTFLSERSHSLMMLQQNKAQTNTKSSTQRDRNVKKKVVMASTSAECSICAKNHFTFQCEELLKRSIGERYKLLEQKKVCTNCLKPGHVAKDCRGSKCKICDSRHNTLLHKEDNKTGSQAAPTQTEQSRTHVGLARKGDTQVLLSTALVLVEDKHGNKISCRALLDSGSQSNIITANMCKKLRLKCTHQTTSVVGVDGTQTNSTKTTQVHIISMHSHFRAELECLVLPRITEPQPQLKISKSEVIIPENINLADPTFNEPGEIDMLIGAGLYWEIILDTPKNKIEGQPALQNTRLGWILGGEIHNSTANNLSTACFKITNERLSEQLERFWVQETIPEKHPFTKEELSCEELFRDTTTRDSNGRFIVRLPTRPEVILGDSKEQAKKRLLALERRFSKQPELKQSYCEFMTQYEYLGHMTSKGNIDNVETLLSYFIPHQAVLRPDSASTKLRVVFDASAKTSFGTSLNDKLKPGPNWQGNLFHITLRFRTHQIVITADIEKMFRQIRVHPEDRQLQKIIWRKDAQAPIQVFELNTITYGTAPAPYLALRCLHELADLYESEFPLAAQAIREDFYMDDCISGGNSTHYVIKLQQQLLDLLSKGGMPLRKWRSNSTHVLQNLDTHKAKQQLMILDKDEACKTLGLVWDSTRDILQYQVELPQQATKTKREVLSKISQIFDPLGLVGPVLIRGKIIMQQLWADGLEWDEPLSPSKLAEWEEYYHSLSQLNQLQIPRNVNPRNITSRVQIFGFSDASERAIGACIYAVSQGENITNSHLICAKSRVAPLKTSSLPRLELEAAVLLTKLLRDVKCSLGDKISSIHLWSDSTIVLGWIRKEPRMLKTFVANRVAKIQDTSEELSWGHVPSEDNPADLISRGTSADILKNNKLWWTGPDWLTNSIKKPAKSCEPSTDLPELKGPIVTLVRTQTSKLLHQFSSLTKLRHIIAYCYRFINNTRHPRQAKTGSLDVEELERAEKSIVRWTQIDALSESRMRIMKNEKLPYGSPLKSLSPFIDNEGLIRVGGRLQNAELPEEQKHPIVLPDKHHITTLIIQREHIRLHHCPPAQLLHAVRQRYWPISGRREAQKIVRNCMKCFRFNPKVPEVLMGDLPSERVSPVARPFTVSGVDYAGPILLRESKRRGRFPIIKGYIAAFVCFSTKAVHLELVSELTTEAFLAALQRFTARRGICSEIFSDNGKNFVGAANALKELQTFLMNNTAEISSSLAEQNITWHFIPPWSPHFGGLWEAAVKIMKRHLYTEIQGRTLTFEHMSTLLCDIEAILNSRPLTPLRRDPNDLHILTPAHFLIGDSLKQPFQSDLTQRADNALSRWQHMQKLRQVLWTRWQREYLQELQKRNKWHATGQRVNIDTLVLLIEDGAPPLQWPRGRVIRIHPGRDGEVRAVTVKTATGTFTRGVKKLCPLPMDELDKD